LALIVFATALVVVPGSFWLTNSRLERDRAPTPDALPAVVAIREVGDDETRSARFGLRRPTSIQILAVGEGMDGEMYDYGWIVNTENGRTVWSMDYDDTEPAGGASKNRMVEETLTLRPGTYEVKYKTDDSHAYDDWNSDPPDDEEAWGITVTLGGAIAEARSRRPPRPIPERPTRDEVAAAVETATEIALETARIAAAEAVSSARAEIAREIRRLDSEDNRIAQLIRAEDDEDLRQRFKLERDTRVMIYALGEGTQGEMHDYAWIENAGSGRTVWRMSYEDTEHAGGAEKNRMVNETINLSAGEYILRYRTDDSHSYDDWNAQAPTDEERYGVTVLRLGR